MEEENDGSEVIETTEESTEEIQEETVEETPEDKIARLESEKAELEDKNKKLYARTKDAEAKTKSSKDDLSNKDLLFLAKNDIAEEAIDEVVEWAKFKKLPIADAYKQLKPKLDAEAEQRKTAQATTTQSPRGVVKNSGADILKKAEATGEVPDTMDAMIQMHQARLERRRGN